MSKMRDTWKKSRDSFVMQIADLQKKNPGLNLKPLDGALRTFDTSFAPLLDKIADAYKAGKGPDMQRLARTAFTSGQQFLSSAEKIQSLRTSGAASVLKGILGGLKECESKGLAVTRNVVTLS